MKFKLETVRRTIEKELKNGPPQGVSGRLLQRSGKSHKAACDSRVVHSKLKARTEFHYMVSKFFINKISAPLGA